MSSLSSLLCGTLAFALTCAIPPHALAAAADQETANSVVIGPSGARYAYALGGTGKGVTIALLDTGITAAHPEFAAIGKLLPGYNAVNGSSDVTDYLGHGTHVAGLVGASRDGHGMYGVAYDARLLPIKIFADNGGGSTGYADAGLRYAIGRAFIVNMSFGTPGSYSPSATQEAVRSGLLLVAAAGNTGAANPEWPARFAKEVWANGQIIAVGAVDANNHIASFSNRAGDTAAWFLVAPGVDISSTWLGNKYAVMSGTSMATPVVSAAAALIKQLWPYLRADQIAAILFATATDLGAPGIDPVYGRGLVNIEKALQPVGSVKTTSADGTRIGTSDTAIRPSAATSKLWNLAASGALRMIALDDFNRGYQVDLATVVSKPVPLSLDQVFGSMDRRIDIADRVLPNGAQLSIAYEHNATSSGRLHASLPSLPSIADVGMNDPMHSMRLASLSLVSTTAGGTELAFGTGGSAARRFGAAALRLDDNRLGDNLALPALANPYFTLVPNASHAAVAQTFAGIRISAGVLSSGLNRLLSTQYQPDAMPVRSIALPQAELALFEMSRSFGTAAVSLALTRSREAGGYLGAQSSGVLSFGPQVNTEAVQLSGAMLATPTLAIAGQFAYGVTPGNVSASRVITDLSDTRTNAFSLAVIASDRMMTGDRLSVALSQPLRAYSGRMALDVIAGIDDNGAEVRERRTFSMVPSARELMAEANYLLPIDGDASLAWALTLRRHPNNLTDAATEKLLALRYFRQF
jgi:hypothetical protein